MSENYKASSYYICRYIHTYKHIHPYTYIYVNKAIFFSNLKILETSKAKFAWLSAIHFDIHSIACCKYICMYIQYNRQTLLRYTEKATSIYPLLVVCHLAFGISGVYTYMYTCMYAYECSLVTLLKFLLWQLINFQGNSNYFSLIINSPFCCLLSWSCVYTYIPYTHTFERYTCILIQKLVFCCCCYFYCLLTLLNRFSCFCCQLNTWKSFRGLCALWLFRIQIMYSFCSNTKGQKEL